MTGKEFFKNEENIKYIKTVSKNMYNNSVLVYYMEIEDYIQEQLFNMYRKIRFYKEDKSQLNTYMIMCIKNKHHELFTNMVNNKRKLNNPLYLHYLDNTNEHDSNSHNYIPSKDDDSTIDFILENFRNILNDKEIEILKYKYYGLSGKEIADKMDTTFRHIEYKMTVIRKKLNNISGILN